MLPTRLQFAVSGCLSDGQRVGSECPPYLTTRTPCVRPNPPILSINQRQLENYSPLFSGCLNFVGWTFMPTRSVLQDCLKTREQQVPALLIQNAGRNFRTQTNFNRTHYSAYFSLRKIATARLHPNRQNRIRFSVFLKFYLLIKQ